MKRILSICFFCGLTWSATAQEQTMWTLRECVEYAVTHNLEVLQSDLNLQLSKQDRLANKGAFLPNVNGWTNYGYNKGFNFDPNTNQRVDAEQQTMSFGVQSQVDLFTGLRKINAYRQAKFQYMAQQYGLEKMVNDISLNVADAYLTILANKEYLKAAQAQFYISKDQVLRVKQMVEAGSQAEGDLFEVEATLAQDEQNVVTAQNNVTLSLLSLKQLLQLDQEQFDITLEDYNLPEIDVDAINPFQIYEAALNNMPEIDKAHYDILAAERNLSMARGLFSPSLSASYNWSNNFVFDYEIAGQIFTIKDQLKTNARNQFGVSLSIPIFNRLSNWTAVQRASIQLEQTRLQMDQVKQGLRQTVEKSYTDALASYKSYLAAEKAIKANTQALTYAEQKFEVGALNSYDFNTAKNRLLSSQADMLRAKYDFIFKLKVLDFYLNQKLSY